MVKSVKYKIWTHALTLKFRNFRAGQDALEGLWRVVIPLRVRNEIRHHFAYITTERLLESSVSRKDL